MGTPAWSAPTGQQTREGRAWMPSEAALKSLGMFLRRSWFSFLADILETSAGKFGQIDKGYLETWPSCYGLRCQLLNVCRRILQNISFRFDLAGGN